MRKLFISGLFIIAMHIVEGQNYSGVTLNYAVGKFEEAKKEIDKLMADPKAAGKAETYLWQMNVYSELFADKDLGLKYPDALKQAMDALDKYSSKEPALTLLKIYGLRPLTLLYSETFNLGRDYFQKQDWSNSFEFLKKCQYISEFIGKNSLNGYEKNTIDTNIVLYAAYAAQNAGKLNEAATRYKALADLNIGGNDYEDIYKFILDYDAKQKDEASFKKYLTIAKKLYPADIVSWNQFETNFKFASISLTDQMNHYKTKDAAGEMGENNYLDYAEAFSSADKTQLDNLTAEQKKGLNLLAADAFSKAFAKNSNGLYAFNAGVMYYNLFGELDDSYNKLQGESPDIVLQRSNIKKEAHEMAAKSIEWLEKAYTILKSKNIRAKIENNSLNLLVDCLATLYEWKRGKTASISQSDYKLFYEKYKYYTSEKNKY